MLTSYKNIFFSRLRMHTTFPRIRMRTGLLCDITASMIAYQIVTSKRYYSSLSEPVVDPSIKRGHTPLKYDEYRASEIYNTTSQPGKIQCFSKNIESINDLFNVCKELHSIKDKDKDEESPIREHVQYKGRGFTLPTHMRYWFRGHSDRFYDLVPTIFRDKNLATMEDLLIKEFKLKNPQPEGTNIFYILSKMQHYGYPTRLLDWTSNIMAAAYFACIDHAEGNDKKDGMIWILEPYKLSLSNRISETLGGIALIEDFDAQIRALQALAFDLPELISDYGQRLYRAKHLPKNKDPYSHVSFKTFCEHLANIMPPQKQGEALIKSIAVEPGAINERLTAQSGKFTISGGKTYAVETNKENDKNDKELFFYKSKFLANNQEDLEGRYLSNLIIPSEYKKTIRKDLEQIMGIDIASFMLDLNSQGKAVTRKFKT